MYKSLILSIFLLFFTSFLFSQNITNKLGSNGSFIISDATGIPVYFNVQNSTGHVGIGSNSFDATNPEQLLIDAGTTNSVNAIYAKGSINNYFQFNIRNLSNGNQCSADVVATSDNGTENSNFMDMGINGSNYVYQTGNIIELGKSNDCYVLAAGNDFLLANSNANKDIIFITGGTATANERMRIKSNGRISIGGVTSPTYLLQFSGGACCSGTTWYNASDRTYKRKIEDLNKYGLNDLMKMRPVSYYYKSDSTNTLEIGFIAQEMKEIIPEVVTGEEGSMGISYGNLIPVLVNAIKEQQVQISEQKKEIELIKSDIQQLKGLRPNETAGMNPGNSNILYLVLFSFIAGSVVMVIIRRKK